MFCPKCGSKLDENIAFCPSCGQAMNAQAQQPAQPAQAAPVTFKRPKKCPHCNRIYETPKMSTTNIVLIVAGAVGLCAFLPLGILLLVLGGTLGRNKIPCPHCGCTPQEAKAKAKIETAQKKLTKAYKPESYTALYKTLDTIDEKFKLDEKFYKPIRAAVKYLKKLRKLFGDYFINARILETYSVYHTRVALCNSWRRITKS